MKLTLLILFFSINYFSVAAGSNKGDIILKLNETKNLTFLFKQTINDKIEQGFCTIEYPKKIYCLYDNEKIMVSNGKSLVIKNNKNKQYYIYSLKKTLLNYILDKNYLLEKIKEIESRIIDNKYINFTLQDDLNKIDIFFDYHSYDLMGWQTEDIYNNLVITFISNVKTNQKIDKKIFILPEIN